MVIMQDLSNPSVRLAKTQARRTLGNLHNHCVIGFSFHQRILGQEYDALFFASPWRLDVYAKLFFIISVTFWAQNVAKIKKKTQESHRHI